MGDRRAQDWSEAREAVEVGHESFRQVAERLGVHHTAVGRAAKREGWVLPPHRPGLSAWEGIEDGPEAAQTDHHTEALPGPQIDAERPIGDGERAVLAQGPTPQEAWGPPEDERSARLWVCARCKLVGYDPNRGEARAWHTKTVCDARIARLDRALDDRPRPLDLMRCPF